MNTDVTKCPRCTGEGGAHFAYCYFAQVWDRVFGDTHPWRPKRATFTLAEVHEIVATALANRPFEPVVETFVPPDDPPDPDGVFEDFLVTSGHVESDADWIADMDEHWAEWSQDDVHVDAAVTHLPDDYYGGLDDRALADAAHAASDDNLIIEEVEAEIEAAEQAKEAEREYNTSGLTARREEDRQKREDAVLQFLYDCTTNVPGSRTLLSDLHDRFVEWAAETGKVKIAKPLFRELLGDAGITSATGRLPGGRQGGRAPLLVHGVVIKHDEEHVDRPPVVPGKMTATVSGPPLSVTVEEDKPKRHAYIGAKPGGELPKQLRELIEPLLTEQGWEYRPHGPRAGRGRPRVINPEGFVCTLPSTPHLNGRTLANTRTFLRNNGAKI